LYSAKNERIGGIGFVFSGCWEDFALGLMLDDPADIEGAERSHSQNAKRSHSRNAERAIWEMRNEAIRKMQNEAIREIQNEAIREMRNEAIIRVRMGIFADRQNLLKLI
jgi:hypothetical protein